MMTVKRTEIRKLDHQLLNKMIENSLFTSPSFLELFEHTGGRPFYLILYNKSDPVALMPIIEYGNGIFKRIQSLTDGLYTKIVVRDASDISIEECSLFFSDFLIKEEPAKLFLYDYYHNFDSLRKYEKIECKTLLVDITNPEWQPPDKKLQSEIRKAVNEQVAPVLFDKKKTFK